MPVLSTEYVQGGLSTVRNAGTLFPAFLFHDEIRSDPVRPPPIVAPEIERSLPVPSGRELKKPYPAALFPLFCWKNNEKIVASTV
jgi:hypothetical protein